MRHKGKITMKRKTTKKLTKKKTNPSNKPKLSDKISWDDISKLLTKGYNENKEEGNGFEIFYQMLHSVMAEYIMTSEVMLRDDVITKLQLFEQAIGKIRWKVTLPNQKTNFILEPWFDPLD